MTTTTHNPATAENVIPFAHQLIREGIRETIAVLRSEKMIQHSCTRCQVSFAHDHIVGLYGLETFSEAVSSGDVFAYGVDPQVVEDAIEAYRNCALNDAEHEHLHEVLTDAATASQDIFEELRAMFTSAGMSEEQINSVMEAYWYTGTSRVPVYGDLVLVWDSEPDSFQIVSRSELTDEIAREALRMFPLKLSS